MKRRADSPRHGTAPRGRFTGRRKCLATKDIVLNYVSCWAANQCIAVGSTATHYDNEDATVSERWNGTSWSYQGILATAEEEKYVEAGWKSVVAARALSCTGENACMAVGSEGISKEGEGGSTISRAERWNGQTWVLEHPPGAAALKSVSCSAQYTCTAIGPEGPYEDTNVIVARNGNGWSEQRTYAADSTDKLERVACPSTSTCVAAGGDIAVHWNGSAWSEPEALPVPWEGYKTPYIFAMDCPSTTSCFAVGGIRHTNEKEWTLLYRWNGTKWIQQAPIKGGGVKYRGSYFEEETELFGVSCWVGVGGEDNCVGVGRDPNAAYTDEPMAVKFE